MTIKVPLKQRTPQIVIDLQGEHGNVFFLIALARDLSHKLSLDFDKIYKRMSSGDYFHAVKIFDAYFGDFVTMHVSEELREQLNA